MKTFSNLGPYAQFTFFNWFKTLFSFWFKPFQLPFLFFLLQPNFFSLSSFIFQLYSDDHPFTVRAPHAATIVLIDSQTKSILRTPHAVDRTRETVIESFDLSPLCHAPPFPPFLALVSCPFCWGHFLGLGNSVSGEQAPLVEVLEDRHRYEGLKNAKTLL